ncbi:MAG: HIRAN domain-containing protein [Janthinobacterium lividum]
MILAWQAPDNLKDRFRWAVGQITPNGSQWVLTYLDGKEFEQANEGRSNERLRALGFTGYPGFTSDTSTHREGVMEAFMRRLPPKSRADFQSYKAHFRLANDLELSDLGLLGRTEAKLPSDGFSVVDPLDAPEAQTDELMMEVAGYRYYAQNLGRPLEVAQSLQAVPEPANLHDQQAIMFMLDDTKIGYVNRLQTGIFHRWLQQGNIQIAVERINGTETSPRAFVFVSPVSALRERSERRADVSTDA